MIRRALGTALGTAPATTLAPALLGLSAANAGAYELAANRLTLVLRDDTHVSMTWFIDYPSALHRALAPQRALPEFVLLYSAMKPAEFQKELLRAQAKFSAGTRLTRGAGEPLPVTNWQWPEAARAQALLQARAMQSLVAAGEHPTESRFEIRAEAGTARPVDAVAIRSPDEFGTVLVVSYRPPQAWAPAGSAPTSAKF